MKTKAKPQNKTDCPTGSPYYRAIADLKTSPAYSEEEGQILARILFILMESPSRMRTFWADTPTHLRDYGPLRDQFILANRMNRMIPASLTQSDVAMRVAEPEFKVRFDLAEMKGESRVVCYNYVAMPGIPR
ncbi:MAG: hypothetical protein WC441_04465 [Patescibacteria group bacterium]